MNKEQYIYDYYLNIVKPTVAEFLMDKSNLRKGRLAAIVLDHVRDYRAVQLDITPNMVLNIIKDTCPDAIFVRDVCNASKHAILTSTQKIPRTVSNTEQIEAESNTGLWNAPFAHSMFGESNYVFIKFDNDQLIHGERVSFRNLHDSINELIKYWDIQLDIED
jgi:hypothetical protein